jgi:hypothetical protein
MKTENKPTINLESEWTYCTPLVTVTYPVGSHVVSEVIAKAAPKQIEQENADGSGHPTPRAPRSATKAQG